LFIVYKHIAIAIENPFTLSDAGISKPFKSKSAPNCGDKSSATLAIPPDDISVANNDGTQSDLYDESIIANQGLTFSVASNGNLTVTV
jgi:hypothetical protein